MQLLFLEQNPDALCPVPDLCATKTWGLLRLFRVQLYRGQETDLSKLNMVDDHNTANLFSEEVKVRLLEKLSKRGKVQRRLNESFENADSE